MRRTLIAAAALAALALPAVAGDETTLFTSGAWSVSHVAFADGSAACKMDSMTEDGTSIGFWGDRESFTFVAIDVSWAAAKRIVQIVVTVDGEGFKADAAIEGNGLLVDGLSAEFLGAVANGRVLALHNAGGNELLRYTLNGSAAGIAKLVECVAMLSPPTSDPFGAGASTDPF